MPYFRRTRRRRTGTSQCLTSVRKHCNCIELALPLPWIVLDGSLMVRNKRLKKMFHSHDHRGGFDEIDGAGADDTKTKRVTEGWQSIINVSSHPPRSGWGSLQSAHDTSLQDDVFQYPLDRSDGGPNSLISRDEVPDPPFALGPKGADGNHGPIGGPITSAVIGPEGGRLEIYGNVLTIPRGALREMTKIELGLVWNKRLRPSFRTDCQMTAILSCQPSGLRFCKPVVLSLPHCLEVNPFNGRQIRPVLYSSHHVNNGRPEWTRCRLQGDSFTFRHQSIEVKVHDFCYLVWSFEDDRPDVDAKRMRIVPYASPIFAGQDQTIRLHMFNDLEAVREKVKKEEEELGGERLTSYHSYVLLKNMGMLRMESTWNTVGWFLSTPPIVMPFREMWAVAHNSCELHFINQMKKPDFKCKIDIQQENNESKVVLSFAHDIQMDYSTCNGLTAGAVPGTDAGVVSLSQEEPRSISGGSLIPQLNLPEVPPPPEIAIGYLSISETYSPSNPRNGSREQQHFSVAGRFFSSTPAQIRTKHRIQPPLSAPTHGEGDQSMGLPAIHAANNMEVPVAHLISPKDRGHLQYGRPAIRGEETPVQNSLNSAEPRTGGRQLATNNFFVQNMNIGVQGYAEQNGPCMVESKCVIPFQLKRRLSFKLDEKIGVKNWTDLSRHWGLDRTYDQTALCHENKPTFVILSVAEERKIVQSLDDLRNALREIRRDDCVDIVNEYEGISSNTASDSDS